MKYFKSHFKSRLPGKTCFAEKQTKDTPKNASMLGTETDLTFVFQNVPQMSLQLFGSSWEIAGRLDMIVLVSVDTDGKTWSSTGGP